MIPQPPPGAAPPGYFRLTRSATYGFLSALPLLVLYHVLILLTAGDGPYAVRVGAEVWIKQALAALGATGMLALGGGVLLVGLGVFFYERRKRLPLRPAFFGWMVAESLGYAVVVALLISRVVGWFFAMAPAGEASPDLGTMLALSIGAGLYEELLFRVVLVGGLYLVLKPLTARPLPAYVVAAVVGAAVFSAVHYVGALGDAFTWPSFTFRFLFGLALNGLFLARGFGVAAWTHALYDVMVVTHLLG